MRRAALALSLAILAVGVLAGCGSSNSKPTSTTSTTSTTTTSSPTAQLELAAREAVEQNARASDYVLVHNAVPSWASRFTAGPALAALRSAAAKRRAGKVNVRLIKSGLQIRSVQLAPSYTSATASIVQQSSVRVYQKGRAVGGVRRLSEPASLELRRVGSKAAFVVWKLAPA